MDLIHSADARELVIALDARYDLMAAGLLLPGDTDDEDAENDRRIELYQAAYRETLQKIGAEEHLTIYLGDDSEATRTPKPTHTLEDDTWERQVWQEAHDRTPADSLWTEVSP